MKPARGENFTDQPDCTNKGTRIKMHSLELLHEALHVAKRLGYSVRQEWLTTGGGVCEVHGRRWIFIDLAQPVHEQLTLLRDVLGRDPRTLEVTMSDSLRRYLGCRRAG